MRVKWVINQCLVGEGGLPQLQVLLGVGEDGLQGATQELLVKILRRPHQRRQRHGHLHLHPGEVLKVEQIREDRGERVRKHSEPLRLTGERRRSGFVIIVSSVLSGVHFNLCDCLYAWACFFLYFTLHVHSDIFLLEHFWFFNLYDSFWNKTWELIL